MRPTVSRTIGLGGTKLKKEKITRAQPVPAPNCSTTFQLMCWRHSHERQPLAAIWITPWNTMATGTGSRNSRKPINSIPPAMPKMPEMKDVTTAATARAARMGSVNIGRRK